MKVIQSFAILFIFFVIVGCAGNRRISNFKSDLKCPTDIYFIYDKANDLVSIDKIGKPNYDPISWGKKDTNYRKAFQTSVINLSQKIGRKFYTKQYLGLPDSTTINTVVVVDKIEYHHNFTKLAIQTKLIYKYGDKEYQIIGYSNERMIMNTQEGIAESLTDGHAQFLQIVCRKK
jgi:hypothetical protein